VGSVSLGGKESWGESLMGIIGCGNFMVISPN